MAATHRAVPFNLQSQSHSQMVNCPCSKRESGELAYHCDLLDCQMFPHFCEKYITDPRWKRLYDEGRGPTQKLSERPPQTKPVPDLPPLRTQVATFLKAMAKFAGDGFRVVDGEEFSRRVGICEGCSRFDRRRGRCRVCGCYGKIKAKGRAWACPKGKW